MITGFLVLCMGALSLTKHTQAHDDDRLYVVTTTAHIADVVRNIGGEHILVDHLMGTGTDPHLYRPVRSDIVKLRRADIVFYNGLHLEGRMVELMEKLAQEKPTIGISNHIPKALIITDEEQAYDPHIWMNAKVWHAAGNVVRDHLTNLSPTYKETYAQNTKQYQTRLSELDQGIRAALNTIPKGQRVLVTAHDAFGYLGQAYGLQVIGIQGLSTDSEAGLKRLENLAAFIAERKIPAIFTETSVSEKNIKALMNGARARGHNVQLGGALYSDAMGADGTYEGTYVGMMEHNVRKLAAALGGTQHAFMDNKRFVEAHIPPE